MEASQEGRSQKCTAHPVLAKLLLGKPREEISHSVLLSIDRMQLAASALNAGESVIWVG